MRRQEMEEKFKIAVFIDFDNIEIGVKSTLQREFDVAAVLDAATQGLVRVALALPHAAEGELGWRPLCDLDEGLELLVGWHRAQRRGDRRAAGPHRGQGPGGGLGQVHGAASKHGWAGPCSPPPIAV